VTRPAEEITPEAMVIVVPSILTPPKTEVLATGKTYSAGMSVR
jgi:hypothetical protein